MSQVNLSIVENWLRVRCPRALGVFLSVCNETPPEQKAQRQQKKDENVLADIEGMEVEEEERTQYGKVTVSLIVPCSPLTLSTPPTAAPISHPIMSPRLATSACASNPSFS